MVYKNARTIASRVYGSPATLALRPIVDIKPLGLLQVTKKISSRGALKQAHRVIRICRGVFWYAVANSKAEGDKYPFPDLWKKGQSISDAAVNAPLRRLGYAKEEFIGYAFRSTTSTRLNELG